MRCTFLEGPLEVNLSTVVWAARRFGSAQRLFNPSFLSRHPPTHHFRTDAKAQKAYLNRVKANLKMSHWQVYEIDWPYNSGGPVKRRIAALASLMSGWHFGEAIFGNRFKAILLKD